MKKGKVAAVLLTVIWIMLLIPVGICLMEIGKQEIRYELQYHANPFSVETVTVINRGSSWLDYEAYEDDVIYEVRVTLKNQGVTATCPKYYLDFEGVKKNGNKEILYTPVVENWNDITYEEESTWTIPPGNTGEYVYFAVTDQKLDRIRVKEKGKKLTGEAQSWEIFLSGDGEPAQTLQLQ